MNIVATTLALLVLYIIGEAIWLKSTASLYKKWLHKFNPTLAIQSKSACLLVYPVLLLTFWYLVLRPEKGNGLTRAFVNGALFGLAVYGVYNLTNVATLIGYSWTMVAVDTTWGTIWFGTLSAIYKMLMSMRLRLH